MADIELDIHNGPPHPYHIVRPSPWPLLGSLSLGLMALGGVMWMNATREATEGYTPITFLVGMAGVILCMVVWWRDVIREHIVEKAHTAIANLGFRYGMALFIASEVMFFVAFFWAFFNAAFFPVDEIWPPAGIETVSPWGLPLMMTLVLLLSGQTVTAAHAAIIRGDQKNAVFFLALTVGLGAFFLFVQGYEYSHATFGFSEGIYPSTFYMATGFHGFHVFVGTVFLFVCLLRARAGHFTPEDHFGFEAAAWYWHFVDVVWLFLFVAVYLWGS